MTKKVETILAGLDATSLSQAKTLTKSPLLTAMEQSQQSPAFQMINPFQNSAAFKAMEAYLRSPTYKAMEAHLTSPTYKATEALWKSQAFKDATRLASLTDKGSGLSMLAGVGLGDLGRIKDVQTIFATLRLHSSVSDLTSASLSLNRMNHWASSLLESPLSKLATLYPGLAQPSALDDILKAARTITEAGGGGVMGGALGLSTKLDAGFADTSLKLSAFVGASDVHGIDAGITTAAYRNLFGEWRTRPDLPERFWRDPKYRHDMYREAQVDEGLIEADVGTTLDIMIEGGLAGGFRKNGGSFAILTYGGLTLCIRSNNLRADAYEVVGKLEETMRDFITAKLKAKAGSEWFPQLVDGNVLKKAKGFREAAVRRGEARSPLITFTDLGELAGIILRGDNWSEVFEDVFINKPDFDHDMQRLLALRRPTAHYRRVDGPRLMEAMCVMARLDRRMKQDGDWKAALESDE